MSDLKHFFGKWDVVLIHKRSRELTLAHKTLIETLSRMPQRSFPKRAIERRPTI
jgi:hypothetical protein